MRGVVAPERGKGIKAAILHGWIRRMSSPGDDLLEDRLIALEIRLTYFERMAEDMSDVLVDQSRTIDVLTAQLRRLRERMEEARTDGEGSPQDDRPPPHY